MRMHRNLGSKSTFAVHGYAAMTESESPGVPLHAWLEESKDTIENGMLLDD